LIVSLLFVGTAALAGHPFAVIAAALVAGALIPAVSRRVVRPR
jgi:hypothetical protein